MIGSIAGVVVLFVVARLVRVCVARFRARRGPDRVLASIGDGPRYLYTQGRPASGVGADRVRSDYDQVKAVKAARAARKCSATGHRFKRPAKPVPATMSTVTPIAAGRRRG